MLSNIDTIPEDSKIAVKVVVQENVLYFEVFNRIVNRKFNDNHNFKIGLKNTSLQL